MNILCVDDERIALDALASAVGEGLPGAGVYAFRSGAEALECAAATPMDVAFLDIEMRGMSGLELAKRLKELHAQTNIVFVTGYAEYAMDAMAMYVSGYLLKPVSAKGITEAMEHLRHPVEREESGKLRVRCFGSFEVFSGGVPLEFARSKSKELLAYLVDRCGAGCSTAEIAAVLWEDGEYSISRRNQLQNYLAELRRTLVVAGASEVLLHSSHNSYSVNTELIDCDLYRCLSGDPAGINAYTGEYMSQYSWAEFTAGMLSRKLFG